MQRRSFIKNISGGSILIATGLLPAFAAIPEDRDKKNSGLFEDRGDTERLNLTYATVEIGLEHPFSILHISDTHLSSAYPHENEKKQKLMKRRTTVFGAHQEEALRDSLEWAKANVDYVLHTGDLIDWQSEANFDLVKKYFGPGVTGCVGNHEYSTDMWLSEPKETRDESYKDNTRDILEKVYPVDLRLESQVINGVNFVSMDNVYGYFTAEQVELFMKEVEKGHPIVLCLHVPIHTTGTWRGLCKFWFGKGQKLQGATLREPEGDYKVQLEDPVTRNFISYLKKEPLLKAILAGHLHINIQDRFSPYAMEYVTAGNYLFSGQEILFI